MKDLERRSKSFPIQTHAISDSYIHAREYSLYGTYTTIGEAEKVKDILKRDGFLVRITKEKHAWAIWTHR